MAISLVTVTHSEASADMQRILLAETGNRFLAGNLLMKYLRSLMGGARSAVVAIGVNAAKATGTVTLSSHVATNTVTINGTAFTCVASGATGNQYNVGADDTETAANLAAAINASSDLTDLVTASSALGVVTVTAASAGKLGNCITIAISANGSVSAARLASGDNGEATRTHYYGSAS